ncbi:hypothetical protein ES708_24389 [subsurface metagenome]
MIRKKDLKQNRDLNDLIKKVNNSYISSIKEVIMQLITVINDPKSSAKDLREIIEKDPPLTASFLKLANSVYYGFNRKISSIHEAIVAIGFNTVKELALAQKVCELFKNKEDVDGYSRVGLWKHSIAVAQCNKFIYMREFREAGENAFTIGLLHNLGIIVEDQFLHNEFRDVLEKAKKDECNLIDSENSIIGFNHADIGMAITNDWNLPEELVSAIGYHHEPGKANKRYRKNTFITYISDYICQRNEMGFCDASFENDTSYMKCLKEMGIREKAMNLIVEDVCEEIKKMERSGWFQ